MLRFEVLPVLPFYTCLSIGETGVPVLVRLVSRFVTPADERRPSLLHVPRVQGAVPDITCNRGHAHGRLVRFGVRVSGSVVFSLYLFDALSLSFLGHPAFIPMNPESIAPYHNATCTSMQRQRVLTITADPAGVFPWRRWLRFGTLSSQVTPSFLPPRVRSWQSE